jgi:hypothetical protein
MPFGTNHDKTYCWTSWIITSDNSLNSVSLTYSRLASGAVHCRWTEAGCCRLWIVSACTFSLSELNETRAGAVSTSMVGLIWIWSSPVEDNSLPKPVLPIQESINIYHQTIIISAQSSLPVWCEPLQAKTIIYDASFRTYSHGKWL